MKKNYSLSVIALFSLFTSLQAQNNPKLADNKAYQRIKKFETPQTKDNAIALYLKETKTEKGTTFESKKESTDRNGSTHQRHQQFYKGIKVEYGTIITHSKNGKVYSINGEVYNVTGLNTTPALSKEAGFQRALTNQNAQRYLWEDKDQAALMNYKKPEGELVILPNAKTGAVNLAYKYDIYSLEPIARNEVYVDAHNGAILYKNPIIKHADRLVSEKESKAYAEKLDVLVTGNAATRYSGSREIETTFNGSKYVLQDDTRGGGIITYDCQRTTNYQSVDFQDNDNNWTSAEFNNTNKDNGALDAHWGAEKTYDFWLNVFGRNSFDDNGAQIVSYVHYRKTAGVNLVNAFWNGSVMSYGDGNGAVNILTSLDVCGHEIGHAICSHTADLVYQNQSGAINEGYSDIWGACIEHYGRTGSLSGTPDADVWNMAEDLGSSPFRSMSDPLSEGNPDTYQGTNWTTTDDEGTCSPAQTNDYCGVHNNSGVLNHWFYILTMGKTGTNTAFEPYDYDVTGIGMEKSSEIAYFAERDYLTSNSTYMDVRNATIQVANELYCPSSPEVIAVTNSWYAVNVGPEYLGFTNDLGVKSLEGNLNITSGVSNPVVKIENGGTASFSSATISYSLDGGAATNTSWNGALAMCEKADVALSLGNVSRGTHVLTVTVTAPGDENPLNDTKSFLFLKNDNGTIGQINTFENTTDNLISVDEGATNVLWERGLAAGSRLSNTIASGSKVYGTNLDGNYPNNMKSYLVSQAYNLTNVQNPTLKFKMGFDLENNFDLAYMEYTTDGGATWYQLGNASLPNWYTSNRYPDGTNCDNCIGGQWTGEGNLTNPRGGTNAQMRDYSCSLSNFGLGSAAPQSNIIFRFVIHTDQGLQREGVIIDNFVVDGTLSAVENTFETFNVWPNPTNGNVNIQLNTSDKVKVDLYDMRGRNVYKNEFNSTGTMFQQEVQFNALEKGIYLLSVESEGKKATKKLLVD